MFKIEKAIKLEDLNILHLWDGFGISEAVKFINEGKADGINFNFTKNFPSNINEVKNSLALKYLQINDYTWEFDYSAINYLSSLECLCIYTTDKKEINYSNYPNLKKTALYWRPKAKSLFECKHLESLFIGKYTEHDLSSFEGLNNLKFLRINTGSVRSLKGIEKLQNLEKLWLAQATKLENISGVEKLQNLKTLWIDNCKNIKNFEVLKGLKTTIDLKIFGTTSKPDWLNEEIL